jgi:VanZ family protein
MSVSNIILRIVGAAGLLLTIWLSVIPADLQVRTSASKGFEHALAYFVLGFVLMAGYRPRITRDGARRHRYDILLLLIGLAAVLEVVQHWSPGRTPSLTDWMAGVFGAVAGVSLFVVLRQLSAAILREWRGSANVSPVAARVDGRQEGESKSHR